MFQKLTVLLSSIAFAFLFLIGPNPVNAGLPNQATIAATTPTTINAGESVTIEITYFCSQLWTTATAQLYLDQQISNVIGPPKSLTPPAEQGDPTQETFIVQFPTAGTYVVDVEISGVVGPGSTSNCPVNSAASPLSVTVASTPTTTTTAPPATTTTVAPATTDVSTTTVVQSLPKTGSDTNNAQVAVAVALAGGAIILGRRRLSTK